jgi:hypothetical protein
MIDLLERCRIVREKALVWIIGKIVTNMHFHFFKYILGNKDLIGITRKPPRTPVKIRDPLD